MLPLTGVIPINILTSVHRGTCSGCQPAKVLLCAADLVSPLVSQMFTIPRPESLASPFRGLKVTQQNLLSDHNAAPQISPGTSSSPETSQRCCAPREGWLFKTKFMEIGELSSGTYDYFNPFNHILHKGTA